MEVKKVLILEANKAVLAALTRLVKRLDTNVNVYAFQRAEEACRFTMERDVDLFLVDMILDARKPEDTSGLTFVEAVRRMGRYAFTPVIFITSLEDSGRYAYEELRCYRYFEKPFDWGELQSAVLHCLRWWVTRPSVRKLYYRREGLILSIDPDRVVCVRSTGRGLELFMKDGSITGIPYLSLKRYLEEAGDQRVLQCSKAAAVNPQYLDYIDSVRSIISVNEGRYQVELGGAYRKLIKGRLCGKDVWKNN